MNWVRCISYGVLGAAIIAGILLFILGSGPSLSGDPPAVVDSALEVRGEYLAAAGDCVACHTAKGGDAFAGGRPLPTPFGTIYSANITADKAHGIGSWSGEAFNRALTQGLSADGSHIYPGCPYQSFAIVSRSDTDAIQSYLLAQAPVAKVPPDNDLPFPFNIRAFVGFWKLAFFEDHDGRDTELTKIERGQYLVDGLGHCAGCHAPLNWAGSYKNGTAMIGGNRMEVSDTRGVHYSFAPALTNDRSGLGSWSREQIAQLLKYGRAYGKGSATGAMAEVVAKSTQYLSDEDRLSIADYLLTLKRNGSIASNAAKLSKDDRRTAAHLYSENCASCHGAKGEGRGLAFAALAKTPSINSSDPYNLIYITLYGGQAAKTGHSSWAQNMPPYAAALSDEEIALILTYIRSTWGNSASALMAVQVGQVRSETKAKRPETGPAPVSKKPEKKGRAPQSPTKL